MWLCDGRRMICRVILGIFSCIDDKLLAIDVLLKVWF
jgi:hypothetical protein